MENPNYHWLKQGRSSFSSHVKTPQGSQSTTNRVLHGTKEMKERTQAPLSCSPIFTHNFAPWTKKAAGTQPFLAIFQASRKSRGRRRAVSFFRAFPRTVQTTSLRFYWPKLSHITRPSHKRQWEIPSSFHTFMGPAKNQTVSN